MIVISVTWYKENTHFVLFVFGFFVKNLLLKLGHLMVGYSVDRSKSGNYLNLCFD